jgi:hypothetical protein
VTADYRVAADAAEHAAALLFAENAAERERAWRAERGLPPPIGIVSLDEYSALGRPVPGLYPSNQKERQRRRRLRSKMVERAAYGHETRVRVCAERARGEHISREPRLFDVRRRERLVAQTYLAYEDDPAEIALLEAMIATLRYTVSP